MDQPWELRPGVRQHTTEGTCLIAPSTTSLTGPQSRLVDQKKLRRASLPVVSHESDTGSRAAAQVAELEDW